MELLHDRAYLITVSGDFLKISPENGKDFELKEAQKAVDGLIEIVYLNDRQIMIINEEGKFSKDYNPFATAIAHLFQSISERDYICGDVIVCPTEMLT